MSARLERTLRIYDIAAGERRAKPVDYWRTRTPQERLSETLQLHREGNELFKGGNPAFAYVYRFREIPPVQMNEHHAED